MKQDPAPEIDDPDILYRLPPWITVSGPQTIEDVAFMSGGALAHLHLVGQRPDIPHPLLRDRLALRAAERCVALTGRPERLSELRDAVHLLRPGDLPGPAGETSLAWQRAVERPISVRTLSRALPKQDTDSIANWLDGGRGGHVARAAQVLETVITSHPRAEATALILADAVLAQGLRARQMTPLLGIGLKRRDLRLTGDELRDACHRAIVIATAEVTRLAAELAHGAQRLRNVAPKLRAKGAEATVQLFLSRDAVAPAALSSPGTGIGMSPRAARRICDRLVQLGAVRELTGRDTFRLYGV